MASLKSTFLCEDQTKSHSEIWGLDLAPGFFLGGRAGETGFLYIAQASLNSQRSADSASPVLGLGLKGCATMSGHGTWL